MFRIALSTSLMAGALLLSACSPSPDRRTAGVTVTPITLAEVSAPAGYRLEGPVRLNQATLGGTADHPISELAPIRVTPVAPVGPGLASAGPIQALR